VLKSETDAQSLHQIYMERKQLEVISNYFHPLFLNESISHYRHTCTHPHTCSEKWAGPVHSNTLQEFSNEAAASSGQGTQNVSISTCITDKDFHANLAILNL